ncbi:hypothetical protein [Kitasatospora kifunensis]|uniref:Secreted protein n=1 Tax=Kitasatospora kifunensis TaxID=58351 RepID=A0A7W7R8S0_KITKI|nr:hypothetical protein [Kitasatospora kifunensis]MBB4927517.1 hypothetical protein [Kitasatospora kifunensis]
MSSELTRRTVLRSTAVAGLLTVGGGLLFAGPAAAAEQEPGRPALQEAEQAQQNVRNVRQSANGWQMENAVDAAGAVWTRPIPGTAARPAVRIGWVETVLVHVAQRFHYEIAELRADEVVGWRPPQEVRSTDSPESNQASGTALALRPGCYPPGVRGGFYPYEVLVIRDILAELDGVVAWGGDDPTPVESLFSIAVPPGDERLKTVAERIRGWSEEPGAGAGSPVDVLADGRRRAAERLEQHQRETAG